MMKNDSKTLKLVQTAVLAGIIIVMALTPVGYLRIGPLSISLLTIPVVIGAMIIGPAAGAVLGTVFGVTSFAQCFGLDPFGTTLMGVSPAGVFLMCIPTRTLMGLLSGLLFRVLRKADRTKTVCYFATGLSGALLNTVLFMSVLLLFFWHTDYIQSVAAGMGGSTVLKFIVAMVGLNGLVEMPVSMIAGGGIAKILSKVIKHSSDGEYV